MNEFSQMASCIAGVGGNAATVPINSTRYAILDRMSGFQVAESTFLHYPPLPCWVGSMYVVTTTSQPADGALIYTLRVSGVDTSVVLTIAANAAAGTYSNTTDKAFCPSQSYLSCKTVNQSITAVSAAVRGGGVYCYGKHAKNSRSRFSLPAVGFANSQGASTTHYYYPIQQQASTTEPLVLSPWPKAGFWRGLYIKTSTPQPNTGNRILTLRVNQADTALLVTIAANAAAGTYSNTTDIVPSAAGDLISYKSVNNATSGAATLVGYGVYFYQ